MFFESVYNYIEMEQTVRPGSIGDSLATNSKNIIDDNIRVMKWKFVLNVKNIKMN